MGKLRRIPGARGMWTTCPRYRDPRKGEDIVVEKHERGFGEPRPAGIANQNHWWKFKIAGGGTDGVAYYTRDEALLAGQHLLRGEEATG